MILVGSTIPAYKMDDPANWGAWLANADAISESHPDGVKYFATLETDARGLAPFTPLLARLKEIGGVYWTFSIDDGADLITTDNRLVRICTGRNLITEHAVREGVSHVLFVDADMSIPDDSIPKMLELEWPIVGGFVPTYTAIYAGPQIHEYPFEVHEHANTAGFLLVDRVLYRKLRWRVDVPAGLTDDPCYHADAFELGYPTRVRYDLIGKHVTSVTYAVEQRGHDLRIRRGAAA